MSNNLPRRWPGRCFFCNDIIKEAPVFCRFKWNRTIHLNLTTLFGLHIILTRSEIPAIYSHKSSDCRTGVAVCVFKAGGCDGCRYNTPCNNCPPGLVCNCRAFVMPLNKRICCRCFDEAVEHFSHLFVFGAGRFRELLLEIQIRSVE
jgi:hypothetical protein